MGRQQMRMRCAFGLASDMVAADSNEELAFDLRFDDTDPCPQPRLDDLQKRLLRGRRAPWGMAGQS
jgi:hypothetical protein